MKVLIVSNHFYPENFKINDLALELKERGHTVEVFTGVPNYPEGKIYPGFSYFNKPADFQGIKVIRAPMVPRGSSKIQLALNYFTFAFFGSLKMAFMKLNDYDVIYVFETSPISVAYPAMVAKFRRKVPLIMNVQDLWPENFVAVTGIKHPLINNTIGKMVNHIYAHCDLILGASQSFVHKIEERVKDPGIVKYWPQYSVVEPEPSVRLEAFDPALFHFIFTGNMGEAQGLEEVVKAVALVENPAIRVHFLGDGRSKQALIELAKAQGVSERIVFHPRVDEALVSQYLQSSDVALLSLKSDPIFDMTIPGKMQTYLACGMPILGCVQGESATIIEQAKCGVVSIGSASEIAKAMDQLAAHSKEELMLFSKNALEYNRMHFNKHKLLEELEHYLKGEQ